MKFTVAVDAMGGDESPLQTQPSSSVIQHRQHCLTAQHPIALQ